MDALFLKILNMSIAASWLILAVILLRIILKKAPKWIKVLLWGIVAIRLICPFSFESSVSLIPDSVGNGKLVSQWADDYIGEIDIYHPDSIYYDAAIGAGREPISDGEGGYYVVTKHDQLGEPATIENTVVPILSVVWLTGILVMLIYAAVSYFRLIRKVGASIHLQDNIWLCDDIQTPFILGCFKPRIYIPSGTDEAQLIHIIAHENAHLKRRDHWWKPLGFVVLAGHWFNPLVWVAYILLCRDIELACDEKVIRELNQCESIAYSKALLACSVNRRTVMVCPLAFGEVGVKERVKRVLNYKKPAFWLVGVAAISCIVIAVCFLTNPISKNTIVMGANYDIEKVLYAVTVGDEISTEPPLQYCVTADYHLYYQQTEGEDWMHLGALEPYDLTTDELDKYMPVDDMRKNAKVRQITDAYILRVGNDNFYLVFQTEDGKTYLAYGWEDVGERGQAGSDDTRLRRLYLLDSSFHSGYVNVNFFERSLINTVGNYVYNFADFESDKIPGYHIIGFKSGDSNIHTEMNDLGFAVFQTTGEGYRLIDCKVYENAALVENGIFFCSDPAVADVNGEMRNDNTFDILLILNEDVDKVERVYHADGKEDLVQADTYINAPYMSVWSWEHSEAASSVSQYVYDKAGNKLPYDSVIPLNSASWKDLPNSTDGTVTKWFDYLASPDEMVWDGRLEINLPVFTDVTFRWYPEKMEAVTENEITPLYTGMPIWNTYFCDLTGDGLPELCSTYTFGSGIIDSRIIIYDYANGVSYELSDRGYYDFALRYNETDGQLYVDKTKYNTDELVESGRLVFKDNCIQVEGFSNEEHSVFRAEILEIHDGYYLVEPIEGSWERSSADRMEVSIRNAAPSPEPEVGDIIEIEYSGDILESYPAQIANVYGIKVVEETHNNESLNDQIVEQENPDDMIGLLGDWILDATYTENVNAGLSLQEMFGTVLGEFGTTLHLNADGTIEYSIGALTGKSTWHNDGDTGRYISELVVYPDEREETLIFYEFRESPESQEYLVLEYNGYSLFWIRTSETIE